MMIHILTASSTVLRSETFGPKNVQILHTYTVWDGSNIHHAASSIGGTTGYYGVGYLISSTTRSTK